MSIANSPTPTLTATTLAGSPPSITIPDSALADIAVAIGTLQARLVEAQAAVTLERVEASELNLENHALKKQNAALLRRLHEILSAAQGTDAAAPLPSLGSITTTDCYADDLQNPDKALKDIASQLEDVVSRLRKVYNHIGSIEHSIQGVRNQELACSRYRLFSENARQLQSLIDRGPDGVFLYGL